MIDRYGDDALIEVDQRITELKLRGRREEVRIWSDIRSAIVARSATPESETER